MPDIDLSNLILSVPARVLRPDASRQSALATIMHERHMFDASVADERTPFFWGAEISSDLIDSHFTHMMPSTLENFRADASAGVSFLPGHKHHELPFGRSIDAALESTTSPDRTRVVADFYTLPGLRLNEINTDDLIVGIRSGILRDVSVGFYGGTHTCDICGRDYYDWDCPHVPGLKYEVKQGDVVRQILSTFAVADARLAEVSSVFSGSTPQAEIIKITREAEAGRLKADAIRLLEQRYRIQLPATKRAFAGVDLPGQTPRKTNRMNAEQITQLTSTLIRAGVLTEDQRESVQDADLLGAADKLAKRVADLEPQAADGRQYRADLVAEALAEGVRAQGKDFDKAVYEGVLSNAPITTVKRMRDDWQRIGNERLKGGRQSVDDDQTKNAEKKPAPLVPDAAYRG